MGGTSAAGVYGAEALFRNPAGIIPGPDGPRLEAALGYGSLFETSYAGSAAVSRSLGEGAVAAGLVYFSQEGLTAYDPLGERVGRFRPYDLAFSLAYARRLGQARAGGGLKLVSSSIDDVSGSTAALDFGVQVPEVAVVGQGPVDGGFSVSHLGPPLKLGSVSSPLPLTVRGGLLWRAAPLVCAALDIVLPVDQDPFVNVGIEGGVGWEGGRGFVRLGFDQGAARGPEGLAGLTAGAGVDWQRLRLDYAWLPQGDLGTANRVTLAWRF